MSGQHLKAKCFKSKFDTSDRAKEYHTPRLHYSQRLFVNSDAINLSTLVVEVDFLDMAEMLRRLGWFTISCFVVTIKKESNPSTILFRHTLLLMKLCDNCSSFLSFRKNILSMLQSTIFQKNIAFIECNKYIFDGIRKKAFKEFLNVPPVNWSPLEF